MKSTTQYGRAVSIASLLLIFGVAVAQADSRRFSGQATVVRATVLSQSIVLSDTGPLPPEGGELEATLLEESVPGLLSVEVLHASTVGHGNRSDSEASVANVNLTVGGNTVSASFLRAEATAQCKGDAPSLSGGSEIAELIVNGQSIVVGTEPNTTIDLPNGRVVINEQQRFVDADVGFADITVNALHVIVHNPLDGSVLADVVISSAHADITCAGPPPPGKDFVTGGGWITGTPSGAKGNFGVAGGLKNNGLWGHLTCIDHGGGMKVKGTSVTAYVVVNTTTRRIDGTAEINGQGGFTYSVVVSDNGEPGRDDTFNLSLSNGYNAAGKLGGGNIQLHTQ